MSSGPWLVVITFKQESAEKYGGGGGGGGGCNSSLPTPFLQLAYVFFNDFHDDVSLLLKGSDGNYNGYGDTSKITTKKWLNWLLDKEHD